MVTETERLLLTDKEREIDMKYTNVGSYSTAIAIGMTKVKEYPDNKNGMSYTYAIRREESVFGGKKMDGYVYVTLRQEPQLKDRAAAWFQSKWGVPQEAYLECMDAYLDNETVYGWYLCLDEDRIIGGCGEIENDFHNRKDLTPNVCAVYTEEGYRCKGIAGHLLQIVVDDLKSKAISPVYLLTDHTGFYERYGWEFFCMVQGDDEPDMSRMYIHR